jgi:hypothetical protein
MHQCAQGLHETYSNHPTAESQNFLDFKLPPCSKCCVITPNTRLHTTPDYTQHPELLFVRILRDQDVI